MSAIKECAFDPREFLASIGDVRRIKGESLFPPPRADGNSEEEPTDNLGPGPGEGLFYA
jgi:hypothetical protein